MYNFPIPVNTQPDNNKVLRIRRGSSIPIALKSYECHFNWAKFYPLTFNEKGQSLLLLKEKFSDEAREIPALLHSISTGISLIAKKLAQVYFNIEIANFPQAQLCLQEADNYAHLCVHNYFTFSDEYAQGFKYIVDGLKVYLEIQKNNKCTTPTSPSGSIISALSSDKTVNDDAESDGLMRIDGMWRQQKAVMRRTNGSFSSNKVSFAGLKHFRKLPPKAKHVVWTVKDVFLICCARSNVERSNWMEDILNMEPYVTKWHFHIYKALHNSRKLRPRPKPFGQERVVADDPLSISYEAMCLTEIFNERNFSPEQYPCRFGATRFETPLQLLATIEEKTLTILGMDCHLDGVYLTFAELYMFTLPHEKHNLELALRCLKKALRLNNTNTKTHYRMGLVYFKMNNVKHACFHFREAIKDRNNIGAIFGLLQILMEFPLKYGQEIQSIFRLAIQHRDLTRVWDRRVLRTLHYLKGCFHFMQEKDEESLNEAITSWIIAHDNESPTWSYYFLNLSHQCARFRWPTKRLNLTNVSNALKHAAYLEQTQFKQLLLDICSEVDDAIHRDREDRKNSFS